MAAKLCIEILEAGFTENGGAIHSAERIMNLWGLRLKYPGLSHINNLRNYPQAEFSIAARAAHARGEGVFIEHVSPLRALTKGAIEKVKSGITDVELEQYVLENFRLVLLTADETKRLTNKIERG